MVRQAFYMISSVGLICSSAIADVNVAYIQSFRGKVLVNQGSGFSFVASGLTLKAGDRILVSKEASATVAYANGCQVSISEPKVLT